MRIIAGTHRGRRYLPPKDEKTTRPISDRVKQSLFDRLWSLGVMPDSPTPGAAREDTPEVAPVVDGQDELVDGEEAQEAPALRVLDIFCGTGSIGLEALSRGAEHCTFVDLDRDAIDRLTQNLTELDLYDQARIVKASALNPIWLGQIKPDSISLIHLDPPYVMAENERTRPELAQLMADLLAVATEDCMLTFRTPKGVTPEPVEGWAEPMSHTYGTMTLHFYTRSVALE